MPEIVTRILQACEGSFLASNVQLAQRLANRIESSLRRSEGRSSSGIVAVGPKSFFRYNDAIIEASGRVGIKVCDLSSPPQRIVSSYLAWLDDQSYEAMADPENGERHWIGRVVAEFKSGAVKMLYDPLGRCTAPDLDAKVATNKMHKRLKAVIGDPDCPIGTALQHSVLDFVDIFGGKCGIALQA
jgi:hypothetical protein